jgi:splicing factor 3B subunit 2
VLLVCVHAGGEDGGSKLSKKQRKLLHRLKIAELKQQCARPDVVEVWDVTAPDPQTLVTLKVRRATLSMHCFIICWFCLFRK